MLRFDRFLKFCGVQLYLGVVAYSLSGNACELSCNAAKASKPLGSRDEVRQTPSPVADASLASPQTEVKKHQRQMAQSEKDIFEHPCRDYDSPFA